MPDIHRAGVRALIMMLALSGTSAQAAIRAVKVTDNISEPTFLTHAPGDVQRLFVLEQETGRIQILKSGAVTGTFLTITSLSIGNERGLRAMAFHPDYVNNRIFYVLYTSTSGADRLSEFKRNVSDPDLADPASERILMIQTQPTPIHNSGQIAFGPDGYLYISFGDGGGDGDPNNRSQDGGYKLGKMLRIDVNGETQTTPYLIPPDNPYIGPGDPLDEIWARGLRNPWRFSFDRDTGDLYIGDVGQVFWEEINYQPAGTPGGQNYGWKLKEGDHCFEPQTNCDPGGLIDPIHEYVHPGTQGDPPYGRAVIGGYVYRGSLIPELEGRYIFGDFPLGSVWSFKVVNGAATDFKDHTAELEAGGENIIRITSFGEDAFGEIYICDITNAIYRIAPAVTPPDSDNDGVLDPADNCPNDGNPLQTDTDGDAQGDACDSDDDNDTVLDESDNCPLLANLDQLDSDDDTVGDACDACPNTIGALSAAVDVHGCPPVVAGDYDHDGDVDLNDYSFLQACLTGSGVEASPECTSARLDADTDVDENDFAVFTHCMSGSNVPGDPDCTGNP